MKKIMGVPKLPRAIRSVPESIPACGSVARWLAVAMLLFGPVVVLAGSSGWPGDARIAVTLTFDLDAETVWWDDPDTMRGQRGPLSQGAYGPRVALPKILALLERHRVHATFFVPTWVAETYPGAIRNILAGGHEIGAHGIRHVAPTQLEPDEERRRLEESFDVLERMTGSRPVGYRAPGWALSDATLELVSQAGFLYSSNLMDADRPYLHAQPAGLVELPVSWVLDDAPHFWFDESSWNKTIRSAATVRDLWEEEFAAAYEMNGYFGLTMHPQFIGRPARLVMFDELLEWIRAFDGVWIATCREVAEHVRETNARPGGS
jgi:peptidoglycan/xylan/chitin deacetylase (PgdA/CDA1 family)